MEGFARFFHFGLVSAYAEVPQKLQVIFSFLALLFTILLSQILRPDMQAQALATLQVNTISGLIFNSKFLRCTVKFKVHQ